MLYDENLIKEIKEKGNIVLIFKNKYGIHKKRNKMSYIYDCPFCNNKETMFVSPTEYHCLKCNEGGNIIDLKMKLSNLNFEQSIESLVKNLNLDVKLPNTNKETFLKDRVLKINNVAARYFYDTLNSENGKPGRDYFIKRKLRNETIKKFGLGYSPSFGKNLYELLVKNGFTTEEIMASKLVGISKNGDYYDKFWNRVMFPIFNSKNHVVGFGGRALDDSKPKYLNSPETILFNKTYTLYGLNLAIFSDKPFILCEGYMDVISMHEAGFTGAIASLGTALTKEQVEIISKIKNEIYLAYDSDDAGIAAAIKAVNLSNDKGIESRIINMKPSKDPDEFIKTYGKDAFSKRIKDAKVGENFFLNHVKTDKYSEVIDICLKNLF